MCSSDHHCSGKSFNMQVYAWSFFWDWEEPKEMKCLYLTLLLSDWRTWASWSIQDQVLVDASVVLNTLFKAWWLTSKEKSWSQVLMRGQPNQKSSFEASEGPITGTGLASAAKEVFIFRIAALVELNPPGKKDQRKHKPLSSHENHCGHPQSPASLAGCCHADLSSGRTPGPVGSWLTPKPGTVFNLSVQYLGFLIVIPVFCSCC